MADSEEGRGVHFMPCFQSSCEDFMKIAATALGDHNVHCVTEYSRHGMFISRFKEAFQQTAITVIHLCPASVDKLDLLKEHIVDQAASEKVLFVNTQPSNTYSAKLPAFLQNFMVRDISRPQDCAQFIKDLLSQVLAKKPSAARDSFVDLHLAVQPETASGLHVNPLFLSKTPPPHCKDLTVAQVQAEKASVQDISLFVLPHLYKKGDIVSLSKLLSHHFNDLGLQVLHLVGRLLLENDYPLEELQEVEATLFNAIEETFKIWKKKVELDNLVDLSDVLSVVYLISVVVCILKGNPSVDNSSLEKIWKRPLFQENVPNMFAKLMNLSSQCMPDWYKVVRACVCEWCTSKGEKFRNKVRTLLEKTTTPEKIPWRQLRKNWPMELIFPVIIGGILKKFDNSEKVCLGFLENYLTKETIKSETRLTLHRIVTSFFVAQYDKFLRKQSKTFKMLDPKMCSFYTIALTKMMNSLNEQNRHICNFHVNPLLFNPNKIVRGTIAAFLSAQKGSPSQSFYHDNMWKFLLLETKMIMLPFLKFDADADKLGDCHQSWMVPKGTFRGHKECSVRVHINRPTRIDHIKYNKTNNDQSEDDMYLREMDFLKELKHENILQLIAFHEGHCPLFYITEDYMTSSQQLQCILVNRSMCGDHFPFKVLLRFILAALKGLQYCHSNRIVHRDLTAANIFISEDNQVKLSGFKHALRLRDALRVTDFERGFMATRWSAPESLQHCSFSKASDMWMVGHVMYEVVTHGQLPYSDRIDRMDEEVMPKVVCGDKVLSSRPCIPPPVWELLMKQCSISPVDRDPDVGDVIKSLEKIMMDKEVCDVTHCHFPDLTEDGLPATKHKKGPGLCLMVDTLSCGQVPESDPGSGYENWQPKDGGNIFLKHCPKSFTTKEWAILKDQNLPGITKLIGNPTTAPDGATLLHFAVAAEYLKSLEDTVKELWLGPKIEPYLQCLQMVASHLTYLHSRRIILCDFSPDTIHVCKVNNSNDNFKVWFTNLPSIKLLPEGTTADQHIKLQKPDENDDSYRRAAKEVLDSGQYSRASDVYCFSMLVWQVFHLYDQVNSGTTKTQEKKAALIYKSAAEVYEMVTDITHEKLLQKPKGCPKHIYQLLTKCWKATMHKRPQMTEFKRSMTMFESEIVKDDFDGYEACSDDSGSDYQSLMSDVLRPINPSEASDNSSDDYEIYDVEPIYSDISDDLEMSHMNKLRRSDTISRAVPELPPRNSAYYPLGGGVSQQDSVENEYESISAGSEEVVVVEDPGKDKVLKETLPSKAVTLSFQRAQIKKQ